MNLWQKILEVQKAVKTVKKDGRNDFHKYDYVTEAAMLAAIKSKMNELGLIALPSVESFETISRPSDKGDAILVLQLIKYTVIDTETGDLFESTVLGSGEDKGDKGAYKGATGGSKYFLMKFFGVPTGDDPENEEAPKAAPKKPMPYKESEPNQGNKPAPVNAQSIEEYVQLLAMEYDLTAANIYAHIGHTPGEKLTIAKRAQLTKAAKDYANENGRKAS